jgi:hypothetical protein
MDHYSILDETPSLAEQASVSSGLAAANAVLAMRPETDLWPRNEQPRNEQPRNEQPRNGQSRNEQRPEDEQRREQDANQSLNEMARADLDAALQLLADRAQYITGATGAAIALRRGEKLDMLCRASTGSNAPGLGAVLSMDHGVSGECVRTRQPLRCDDVLQDPRVNQKACSKLGIASLVVTPIMNRDTVLGVFELFSGKPRSFNERDLSTLMRLSQLAETAVKHATAAQALPQILEEAMRKNRITEKAMAAAAAATGAPGRNSPPTATPTAKVPAANEERKNPSTVSKPLLWSAASQIHAQVQESETPLPAVRIEPANLQKCQACGFPVSHGRDMCVECEEQRWRGQKVAAQPLPTPSADEASHDQVPIKTVQTLSDESTTLPAAAGVTSSDLAAEQTASPKLEEAADSPVESPITNTIPAMAEDSAPFKDLALESESWFAQNKYIFATIVVIAVIAAIVWLR